MSMMVSFVLSFFPRDVLDEILNLIESVSEDFPSYSFIRIYNLLTLLNQREREGGYENVVFNHNSKVKFQFFMTWRMPL